MSNVFTANKTKTILVAFTVVLLAVLLGYLMATQLLIGIGFSGLIIGIAVILICLLNTEAGLYINLIYTFFAFHASRIFFNDQFPVGVFTDVLIVATLFSFFVQRISLKKNIEQFIHTPVLICILIVYAYVILQVANPYAHSVSGWFQAFRKSTETLLLLLISYNVFKDYKSIRKFLIFLFVLCTVVGLYGCIQQWHGLFPSEYEWVMADEKRFGLIYINGEFRKFSTFSDPTSFGVLMAAAAILFMVIAWNQTKRLNKFILFAGVIVMLLGMAYSQTRTANAMVVAGLVMFILLTLDKRNTQIFFALFAIAFLMLLYLPIYSNPTLNRFRTTFIGSNDESFKVRETNRAFIQPYIYTHPIGGGLCTTGESGKLYNPGHVLAGFPPDSGYLRTALEGGWIGLILICILYFVVMKTGIKNYFESNNKQVKYLYAACLASIFSFYIAEFAQDILGQITNVVLYYPSIAIILKLKTLNQNTDVVAIPET